MGDERSGRKLDSDIFQGGEEPVGVALIPKLDAMQARKTITVEDLPSRPPAFVERLNHPQNHRVTAEEGLPDRFLVS